jgi:hypothetical protein
MKKRFERHLHFKSPAVIAECIYAPTAKRFANRTSSSERGETWNAIKLWFDYLNPFDDIGDVDDEASSQDSGVQYSSAESSDEVCNNAAWRRKQHKKRLSAELTNFKRELKKYSIDEIDQQRHCDVVGAKRSRVELKTLKEFYSRFSKRIQTLVCALLSCAATSATSERAFSASGPLNTHVRNRLGVENLEKLTLVCYFLSSLAKQELNDFIAFFATNIVCS